MRKTIAMLIAAAMLPVAAPAAAQAVANATIGFWEEREAGNAIDPDTSGPASGIPGAAASIGRRGQY